MTETRSEEVDLDAIEARGEKAGAIVNALCSGKMRWKMTIPVDEERDCDVVITAALMDGADLSDEVRRLRSELERTEGDLGVAIREAAAAREALKLVRGRLAWVPNSNGAAEATALVDAALDQRFTR